MLDRPRTQSNLSPIILAHEKTKLSIKQKRTNIRPREAHTHLCLQPHPLLVRLRRILDLYQMSLRLVDELDFNPLRLESGRLFLSLRRQNTLPDTLIV